MSGFLVRDDFTGPASTVPFPGPSGRTPESVTGVSSAKTVAVAWGGDATSEDPLCLDGGGRLVRNPESFASKGSIGLDIPNIPETNILELTLRVDLSTPWSPFYSPSLIVACGDDLIEAYLWAFDGTSYFHYVSGTDGRSGPIDPVFVSDSEGHTEIKVTFSPGTMTVSAGGSEATCASGRTAPWSGDLFVYFNTPLSRWTSIDAIQVRSLDGDTAAAFWTGFVGTYEVP